MSSNPHSPSSRDPCRQRAPQSCPWRPRGHARSRDPCPRGPPSRARARGACPACRSSLCLSSSAPREARGSLCLSCSTPRADPRNHGSRCRRRPSRWSRASPSARRARAACAAIPRPTSTRAARRLEGVRCPPWHRRAPSPDPSPANATFRGRPSRARAPPRRSRRGAEGCSADAAAAAAARKPAAVPPRRRHSFRWRAPGAPTAARLQGEAEAATRTGYSSDDRTHLRRSRRRPCRSAPAPRARVVSAARTPVDDARSASCRLRRRGTRYSRWRSRLR